MPKKHKTGGRTKGTPNKLTANIRQALEPIIEAEIERLPQTLEAMEPKERANVLSKLLPYVAPKLQSIEISEPELPGKDISNMTGDQVAQYISKLTGVTDTDLRKHFHRPVSITGEEYKRIMSLPEFDIE